MDYAEKLAEEKELLTNKWIQSAMSVYPAESLTVLNRNKDPFANPMPHLISKAVTDLFEEFLKGIDEKTIEPILDRIVRLKAVQALPPSRALGFILELKDILADFFKADRSNQACLEFLIKSGKDIDRIASVAFDIYVSCRESLFEIKTNEIRNQTHMLIRRVSEMDKQNEAR